MPPKILKLPPNVSLQGAIDAVTQKCGDGDGVICPCCEQQVTIYDRYITPTMAEGLLHFYSYDLDHPGEWLNFPKYARSKNLGTLGQGGDWVKLALWKLIERQRAGKGRTLFHAGEARITAFGRRFCERQADVKKFARVLKEEFLGFTGPKIGIAAALGAKYVHRELVDITSGKKKP